MSGSTATLKLLLLGEDKSASKALSGVGNTAVRTEGRMHKLSKAAGVALVGGLTLAAAAAVKFTKQAAEDSQAQARLAFQLQRSGHATKGQVAAVEEWITAQGKATGITDDELRPALSRLVTATHDVDQAQRNAVLAQDVAAGTGKSYKTVVEAMAKAYNGNISGLSRLGVATKDASGKTKDLNAIMMDLSDTYRGSAADAADTTAGKQKILSTQMSELGESIGYQLLPYMDDLVSALTEVVDWTGRHTTAAEILVGVIFGLTAAVAAWNGVVKVAQVVSEMYAAAQWALNAAMNANPIGLIVIALAALVGGLIYAYKHSETFRSIVQTAFKAVAAVGKWLWNNVLKPAFEGMKAGLQAVGKAGIWLWNNALQPAFKFIVSGVAGVLRMWASMLRGLSHVPGFGWAKDAANALDGAADKAQKFADGIKKIPDHKEVSIHTTYSYSGLKDPTRGHGGLAGGTSYWRGGATWVGERGPEIVDLPRGSRVYTASQSRAMMSSGSGASGDLGTVRLDLRLNGKTMQTELLRLKRVNGGLSLGLA